VGRRVAARITRVSATEHRVGGFAVGDSASFAVTITAEMVARFVELTGDDNPVHTDPAFARATSLGRPVAHGMLGGALVSTLIGRHLPGPGALWLSQTFEFVKPVRIGDVVSFRAEVMRVQPALSVLDLDVRAINQAGDDVIRGRGRVKALAARAEPRAPAVRTGAIVVTGASGTIGGAVARTLAAQGCDLVLAARAREVPVPEGAGRIDVARADLADLDDCRALARRAAAFGPVAGLVHCAAAPIRATPVLELDPSSLHRHVDVAAGAFVVLAQLLAPAMTAAGALVALGTEALDEAPPAGWAGYLAGKAALGAVVRALAGELGPRGIRTNLVAPGMVESAFTADVPERARLVLARQTPLRRLCTPEDVANAVAFLLSPQAAFINGETLRLSGGRIMR